MTEVRIRQATNLIEDAKLVDQLARCWQDVSNAGGPVGFPFLPVSIDQVNEATNRLARDVASGSVLVFVAEVRGQVVGWVSLRLNDSELTRHWASVQRLQSRPDSRGFGIGEQLMSSLATHAASIGLEQLRLVLRGGETLEDFYERLGWQEIGRHPAALRLATGDRDEVSMLLELRRVPSPPDRRLSFNKAADVYDEIRPTYPPELYDDLFNGLPSTPHIIEVGPGTGQATQDLIDRGATVQAIEIGPAMAAKLQANLPTPKLEIIIGDFETVDVPAHGADVVFSASAYHWVSPQAQLDRPATLLKAGGTLAILDLVQVTSPDDQGFFTAAQSIYDRHGQGHEGPRPSMRTQVDPPIRRRLADDSRFTDVELRRYDWNQTYSSSEYRKLMLSYSGTQTMPTDERTDLLDDIEGFIDAEFGGQITRPLVVALTTGKRSV